MPTVSFSRRLADLAADRPEAPAVTCGDDTLTRAGLEVAADRLARLLRRHRVVTGSMVTIALPNSTAFLAALVAVWKLGAVPQPVSARLPRRELEHVVALADPPVVLGPETGALDGRACLPLDRVRAVIAGIATTPAPQGTRDDGPLPDAVSPAWKAPTSGGSTGRPKLIVSGDPGMIDPDARPPLLIAPGGCMVMPGPLYHNGPLVWSSQALLAGNHLVVLPRFDAAGTLAAIERYRADIVYLVPTMMKRIWRLPPEVRDGADLSSLRVVWHLAEPCPQWLKQAWIDWLGPERIVELYAGTEAQVATVIRGDEWLAHRGSVGRPTLGEVAILDEDGSPVPAGVTGEVWLRSGRDTPAYHYVGAVARRREGGWESLGDNGWLDADGYLYLGDRTADMILSGGANIYPAEVESALDEHPAVQSCAVVGLPDDDMGSRVHAIVQADAAAVDADALRLFLAERLVSYKIPRSVEFVTEALRDDAGKVRRSALRAARSPTTSAPAPGAPSTVSGPADLPQR